MCARVCACVSVRADLFVLVCILEARDAGYDARTAIARGLYNSGYVITAAGTIMAVSFFGLMMSRYGRRCARLLQLRVADGGTRSLRATTVRCC
jgi:uncharacterized membrane protein YdfJ with MMPL/SSD domain